MEETKYGDEAEEKFNEEIADIDGSRDTAQVQEATRLPCGCRMTIFVENDREDEYEPCIPHALIEAGRFLALAGRAMIDGVDRVRTGAAPESGAKPPKWDDLAKDQTGHDEDRGDES
jgi:hypothetical protein